MAAGIAAQILNIHNDVIRESLKQFAGVDHRLQYVATVRGVRYINDSKATNVDATLKAVGCMKRDTVLLVGGKDKGYDYDKLFAKLNETKVTHAILYGENRLRLIGSAMRCTYGNISVCERFEVAVRLAKMLAKSGQNVLLSPASASFDEFTGYEERGDRFVEIVETFQGKADAGDKNEVRDAAEE
jgi:UDP-N-acetylmuramoylalanine--D-glutamate ligase